MDGYYWQDSQTREYHSQRLDYRNALSRYLQAYRWDAFCTVTFRKPKRDSIYWGNQIWHHLYDRSVSQRLFLISEPHTTGYLHYHGLLKYFGCRFDDELVRGLQCEADTERLNGVFGISEVSPIRMLESVSPYLTKYVVKASECNQVDYQFFGDWRTASNTSIKL